MLLLKGSGKPELWRGGVKPNFLVEKMKKGAGHKTGLRAHCSRSQAQAVLHTRGSAELLLVKKDISI